MLNRRRLHAQRGQTLVEFALFMPLLLLAMLALIFFSRLGVLSERSQSAVRYGEMVSFKIGQPYTVATVESVIDELLHINSNELGPLCLEPTGGPTATATVPPLALGTLLGLTGTATPAPQNTSIANRVAADTQAALVQAQVVSAAASAEPSAKPYWRPDHIAGANCNPASIALQSGSFGVGNLPVSVQTVSISSSLNIPTYLAPYLLNGETSAEMGFLNVATPNVLLACVPGVSIALTILAPATAGKTGPACPGNPVSALGH